MWQPIETAPKDGTIVLLAGEFDYPGDWRIKIGYWSACDDDWYLCWASWKPTHWMPLPDAPGAQAQPAPSFADAYQGAMEEVAIWKKRALEAEELNRKFVAEINGPVYMGEPAQPAPSVPDDVIEQAVNRFLSWKLPKDFHPDGGMVFIPTKGRGYDSPHWPIGTNLLNAQQAREMLRHVLAAAPEAKP